MFLTSAGQARAVDEYESIGRTALQLLVPSNGIDAYRLRPAAVDSFWKQMKDLGPANFNMLLPADQARRGAPAFDPGATPPWSKQVWSDPEAVTTGPPGSRATYARYARWWSDLCLLC